MNHWPENWLKHFYFKLNIDIEKLAFFSQSTDQFDNTSTKHSFCLPTHKPDGPTARTPTQLVNYLSLTNGPTAEEDQDYWLYRVKIKLKTTDRCHFAVLEGAGLNKSRSERLRSFANWLLGNYVRLRIKCSVTEGTYELRQQHNVLSVSERTFQLLKSLCVCVCARLHTNIMVFIFMWLRVFIQIP